MKKLTRDDFRGWTWKLGTWEIEFVTIQHFLRVIAISSDKGRHLEKRFKW